MGYVIEAIDNYDGKAGDSSCREVRVAKYWNYSGCGTVSVYRFSGRWDKQGIGGTIANRICKAAYKLATNNNIGYLMARPSTLYNRIAKLGWRLTHANKKYIGSGKYSCDCSTMVPCAVNCANVPKSKRARHKYVIPGDAWTGNLATYLKRAGAKKVSASTYNIKTGKGLKSGDIILAHNAKTGTGHTGIYSSKKSW